MTLQERLVAAEAELAAIKKEIEAEQAGSLLPPGLIPATSEYYNAVSTMLELRQQPGSEAARNGEQWVVTPTKEGSVKPDYWDDIVSKTRYISPCFRTKEHAEAAIKAVGADRIMKMFRTLHGVSE
jgi:hypothetical protein